MDFKGGDISCAPHIKKETNCNDEQVTKDWDVTFWKKWNPHLEHEKAIKQEKQYLLDGRLSDAPIWGIILR